ncbi:putative Rhodanese-like domain, rhodanase, Rhodanese-like domain superfamily [Dioscorea sansibarensis]
MATCSCAGVLAGAPPALRRRITFSCPRIFPILTSFRRFKCRSRAQPTWTRGTVLSLAFTRGGDDEVAASAAEEEEEVEEDVGFLVVNFYKFVLIEDPLGEVYKHLSFLQGLDIHGRIYLSEQGINAQFSGPTTYALAYADWIKDDDRFSDILVQISPTITGHAFPRLRVRYKSSLVQVEGGTSDLSLLDPNMRATPLAPFEWRERLQAMNKAEKPFSQEDSVFLGGKSLLLDVRNGYEWDVGHFQGAERPNVDSFRNTSFGLSEQEEVVSDPLTGIDKENTDILMYCTGGIRCDVYSAILRQKGFRNLYTLSGGVSNYLKNEGPADWVGNLFVFDSRLSLPPSAYKPEAIVEARPKFISESSTFARCYLCRSELLVFKHRNCANIDCNFLFLSCKTCVDKFRGCCSLECKDAPRLRPVLPGHQRYQKWHIYRDGVLQSKSIV